MILVVQMIESYHIRKIMNERVIRDIHLIEILIIQDVNQVNIN